MNCIVIDDEPLARRAIELLIEETGQLELLGSFNSVASASRFMKEQVVDLIFLDIQMPQVTGMEFARNISGETLIIFTTAYTEYAIESYEVDAIDYLVKPIELPRFRIAVNKALSYHELLLGEKKNNIESIEADYLFIKSDRRYYKIAYEDILFIEGLKDYSIIQCENQRFITRMNLKNVFEKLPANHFYRVGKSNIVNVRHINSFDNNSVFIGQYEITIGNSYREAFLDKFLRKRNR